MPLVPVGVAAAPAIGLAAAPDLALAAGVGLPGLAADFGLLGLAADFGLLALPPQAASTAPAGVSRSSASRAAAATPTTCRKPRLAQAGLLVRPDLFVGLRRRMR